jgi:hypothetical protein
MVAVLSWIGRKLRCGTDRIVERKNDSERTSRGDSTSSSSVSTVVNPVVYIDKEGFEWAVDDGAPERPAWIPSSALFIPIQVRPRKGYLKNQVLTNCEVPDSRSPDRYTGPCLSMHTEQLFRRLRARSADVCETTGAHVRSRSGKHLIRQDLARGRDRARTADSLSTSSSSDRLKPPSERIFGSKNRYAKRNNPQSSPMDIRTYLDMRAKMAAYRR